MGTLKLYPENKFNIPVSTLVFKKLMTKFRIVFNGKESHCTLWQACIFNDFVMKIQVDSTYYFFLESQLEQLENKLSKIDKLPEAIPAE